jgi:sensor histidine kinase YesM
MFAIWTFIGLAFAQQFYVSNSTFGNRVTWRYALSHSLADWYTFALLSIPAVWLTKRFTLGRANWLPHSAFHLAASLLFSILIRAVIAQWQLADTMEAISFQAVFNQLLAKSLYLNVFIYWALVSVTHAFDYYGKFHERERKGLELEQRLTEARLQALQCQLNPHFLFNTLHAISALMHKDVDAADRMIVRLSELLRYALESTEAHEVPLSQELRFLDRYLEIEQTRFGKRLEITKQFDPKTLEAKVPNLILQPIVENAIRHGIESQSKAGKIELKSCLLHGRLQLQVCDNGPGLAGDEKPLEGVGLSNTRARLNQLYGSQQQLEFESPAGGGFIVNVLIPFRREMDAKGAAEISVP